MKTKLSLLVVWAFTQVIFPGNNLRAQNGNIESSPDAKSYLGNKNMSVDHVTGLFNYRVPIHEIKMGDFTLPISLDHCARGVTVDDKPGILGYNWNLNVGGVVTRHLRGGIADETFNKGAAYLRFSVNECNDFPWVDQDEVDKRAQDGEVDIFTAVFNGRSVSFFLRAQGRDDIIPEAVPLEPTGVKITCYNGGWEIVDEEGNVYEFTQEERSFTTREGNVSINQLDVGHVSAWFLTRVIPAGMPAIKYEYYRDVENGLSSSDSIIYKYYSSRTAIRYHYGKPIIDRPYQFSKYAGAFQAAMDNARRFFDYTRNVYTENTINSFITNELGYANSSYPFHPGQVYWRLKSFGVLDTNEMNALYNSIISTIDNIIRLARENSGSLAVPYLNEAKNLLITCRDETEETTDKIVYQYSTQTIKTPMLKRIRYNDRVIEFRYDKTGRETFRLTGIHVLDKWRQPVCSYEMRVMYPESGTLDRVEVLDKEGTVIQNIEFGYYPLESTLTTVNCYGEYIHYDGPLQVEDYVKGHRFDSYHDLNRHYNSLMFIQVGKETSIRLSYYPGSTVIDKIEIANNVTGQTDRVSYEYSDEHPVYPGLSQVQVVDYGEFKDILQYDRMIPKGPDVFLKTGNHGYYYRYVTERFKEYGSTSYEFIMPDTTTGNPYNYWEIGNPVREWHYDNLGRLSKRVEYVYDDQLGEPYKKTRAQYRAGEYMVDRHKMYEKYKDTRYYVDNIACRLDVYNNAAEPYPMVYNYKSYLTSIKEYNYESSVLSDSTVKTFEYDLSRSTMPTRTVVACSDGTKQVQTVRRAVDFEDNVDPSIALLKKENKVGIPLQTRVEVEDYTGRRQLVSETVNLFANFGDNYNSRMMLACEYTYLPGDDAEPGSDGLFGFERANYDVTTIGYTPLVEAGAVLPSRVENSAGLKEIVYDETTLNVILTAENPPAGAVVARDFGRFKTCDSLIPRPGFSWQNLPSLRYRLFIVSGGTSPRDLVLVVNGVSKNFTLKANFTGPQVFDLDLTASGEIRLESPGCDLFYIALVPADCEFEAVSYNADGTVYCKFDHAGRMERYEYDAACRPVKVFDKDGKLLKEHAYNVVLF